MYEAETFEEILDRVLGRVPDAFDIRESSFLFNAVAPIAIELQNMYLALDNILNITYFDTADREGKFQRCKERGIDVTQFDATTSIVVINTAPSSIEIEIGSRFNYNDINFIVTSKISDGSYYAECEVAGTVGNVTGVVIPVDYVNGFEAAEITSIYRWGENEADEAVIDEVYYASLNSQAFGGNRADYIDKMKKIAGVGGVKIYTGAEWQGGGTVKLVFTTSAYTIPNAEFVASIQEQIDPVANQGEGYGIAPIGHTVTVIGASESSVDVDMVLTLESDYTWEDVSEYVEQAIDSYFTSLNSDWEDSNNIIVRISQIETRILDITGIIDITGTKLNGAENNLTIGQESIVVRGSVNATA